MFHVSTLLPYTRDSKQQNHSNVKLERKRHIGNDIVTVVFQDCEDESEPDFTPSSARSQFQHIFALVTFNKQDNSYRLKIYSEQSVPPFGPSLPCPSIFTNHKEFREFLLVKLINGEKSAFNNSVFGKRRKRTIEAIIKSMHDKENERNKPNGEIFVKRRDDFFKSELLRIGQNLKLQTVIKGDAPTSQITTAVTKKQLWEPKVFLQLFEDAIITSDSWNNCLVVSTINGVFLIDEAIPWELKQIFDKSVQMRQLDIIEQLGLMIFLNDRGRICVFKLSEFSQLLNDSSNSEAAKTRAHCKERKLEFPQQCTVYTQSTNHVSKNGIFKLMAACGKKIYVMESRCVNCGNTGNNNSTNTNNSQYNSDMNSSINDYIVYNASYISDVNNNINLSINNSSLSEIDLPNFSSFIVKKELNVSDVPQLMKIIENMETTLIICAYKSKCEVISEKTGECLKQFQFSHLSTIRSIVELYDNDKLEILLTHSYTSEFIKLDCLNVHQQSAQQQSNGINEASITKPSSSNSKAAPNYTFRWNSEPNHVLCLFPYLIGFADQFIEIRLLVNGNLVNSLCLSNVKLIANKKEIFFAADHESFILNELSDRFFNSFQINVPANPTAEEFSPPISPKHGNNQLIQTFQPTTETNNTSQANSLNSKLNGNTNNNTDTYTRHTQLKEPCTIYNINVNFLNCSPSSRNNNKFFINQLVENSTRTIKRDTSNYSSQFAFNDSDDMPQKNSIYQKIIASNANEHEDQKSKDVYTNSDVSSLNPPENIHS